MTGTAPSDGDHDFEDEHEFFEERAGILEFDAGFSREEAERRARIDTLARYFEGDASVIIQKALAQGLRLRLVDGVLRMSGPRIVRDQWLFTLSRFRDELRVALSDTDHVQRDQG